MALRRPAVRYHGGKWKLAPWIIGHFPPHRVYVEPFGGGASVLLRKPRCYAEVYNDLDGEIVNLFRVLRDQGPALVNAIYLTPFSRVEFQDSYQPSDDPVEQARRTVIRSFMGFGSAGACGANTGFRSNSNRSGTAPAHDWANYPSELPAIIERLRGVVIENRNAAQVMATHDGGETLHYVDPPYLPETRDRGNDYKHEMSELEHLEMLDALKALRGAVVLSGYESAIYDAALDGWTKVTRSAHADGAQDRVEVLWLNSKATGQRSLFAGVS
jgi:DNA adenine methylase